jgi:hypothetical protein
MERICHKCGRDYSNDPFWTSKLRRHLERKNPCDRPVGSKYIREPKVLFPPITPLDSIIWEPKKPPKGTSNRDIVPWLFKDVFSNESNICFVQPNRSRNDIFVKVSNDSRIRMVNVDGFIQLFVNRVFLKNMYNLICEGHLHSIIQKLNINQRETYQTIKDDAVDHRRINCPSYFTGNFFSESLGYTSESGFIITENNGKGVPNVFYYAI